MVESQIVYLVSETHHMTVAIRGAQTRVTRDFDNFEVIQDHGSAEIASREFARWLARASAEGWDLDPEVTPNPAPIDQPHGFEPTPEHERLWRDICREEEEVWIVDLHRQQSRRDVEDLGESYDHPVWQGVRERLVATNPPHLRVTGSSRPLLEDLPAAALGGVEIIELGGRGSKAYLDDHGDLATVLQAMPALKALTAAGSLSLTKTPHDSLGSLTLIGDPLETDILEELRGCKFPKLKALTLRLAWEAEPDQEADKALATLLSGALGKGLVELQLSGGFYPEEYLGFVLSAKLPKLKRLVLTDEFSDVEGALELLKKNVKRLAGVQLVLNMTSWEDEELAFLGSKFEATEYAEE